MEILETKTLTNHEVLQSLRSAPMTQYPDYNQWKQTMDTLQAKKAAILDAQKKSQQPIDRKTEREILAVKRQIDDHRQLESTSHVKSWTVAYLKSHGIADENLKNVAQFFKEVDRLVEVSASEKVMLANLRPSSLVELHTVIELCQERMSEEDTLSLLQLIKKLLPTT